MRPGVPLYDYITFMYRRLIILMCLTGCGIVGPNLQVTNRRPLDPVPAEYPGWYADAEVCLDVTGDFRIIMWYVADELIMDGIRGGGVLEPPNRITMRVDHVQIRSAVKHEMIHHILQTADELHGTDILAYCS